VCNHHREASTRLHVRYEHHRKPATWLQPYRSCFAFHEVERMASEVGWLVQLWKALIFLTIGQHNRERVEKQKASDSAVAILATAPMPTVHSFTLRSHSYGSTVWLMSLTIIYIRKLIPMLQIRFIIRDTQHGPQMNHHVFSSNTLKRTGTALCRD